MSNIDELRANTDMGTKPVVDRLDEIQEGVERANKILADVSSKVNPQTSYVSKVTIPSPFT